MQTDWDPIKLGRAEVLGVDPEASGLLLVDVTLEPRPDRDWVSIFGGPRAFDGPPGHSVSLGMHSPRLNGATVQLRLPDDEVDRYVESLRDRVRLTNEHYEQAVLPRRRREAEAKRAEEQEQRQRIEEAQKRLHELTDGV